LNAPVEAGAQQRTLRSTASAHLDRLLNKNPSSGDLVESLDGLRGFAVLIVIASHVNLAGMRGQGAMGVWLFYILSGFLLTRILLAKLPDSLSARGLAKYFIRRIARILPLYYLTLTLVMFVEQRGSTWLFRHFAFLQADGHFWSIPQEELFYVLLPLLAGTVVVLARMTPPLRAGPAFVIALLLAIAMSLLLPMITLQGNGKSLPFYGDVFVIGFACAFLARTKPVSSFLASDRHRIPLDVASAIVVILLLFTSPEHVRSYRAVAGFDATSFGWSHPSVSGLLCAILLAASLKRGTWANRVFAWRPLRAIGVLSFSLYLYHPIVQDGLTHIGLPRAGWLAFAALLVLCTLVALVIEALIERPCMNVGRRINARIG
jgi:peptidoglycan/LPS O-acetylase OafA/YrhL